MYPPGTLLKFTVQFGALCTKKPFPEDRRYIRVTVKIGDVAEMLQALPDPHHNKIQVWIPQSQVYFWCPKAAVPELFTAMEK